MTADLAVRGEKLPLWHPSRRFLLNSGGWFLHMLRSNEWVNGLHPAAISLSSVVSSTEFGRRFWSSTRAGEAETEWFSCSFGCHSKHGKILYLAREGAASEARNGSPKGPHRVFSAPQRKRVLCGNSNECGSWLRGLYPPFVFCMLHA